MGVFRAESGLVFDDTLGVLSSRWTVSPSDKFNIQAGGLNVSHSSDESIMLTDIPQEDELVLEVLADYVPERDADEGGIVVWKSSAYRLDFLESKDSVVPTEYSRWRAHKQGNRWSFSACKNRVWELFDETMFSATRFGVTLKGIPSDGFKDMLLKRIVLAKGTNLLVGNLIEQQVVEVLDNTNTKIFEAKTPATETAIEFPLPYMPFAGTVVIKKSTGELLEQFTATDFYGGDKLFLGADLTLLHGGNPVSKFDSTFLGRLMNGRIQEKFTLRNDSAFTVKNTAVSVIQYRQDKGYTYADIAPDNNGAPGTFADVIPVGVLAQGQSMDFWLKIEKTEDVFSVLPMHFFLNISYDS